MKIIFTLLLLLLLQTPAYAQQNFFNIPSGQITPEREFFYQHQLNVFNADSSSSKQHFVYGVDTGTEVGVNFLNAYPMGKKEKDAEYFSGPHSNILAATLLKSFRLSDGLDMAFGGQLGVTRIGKSLPSYLAGKAYSFLTYFNPDKHFRITGGLWLSERRFNGPGDQLGFMFGGEWNIIGRWHLMGDWISGNSKNSVSVIGGMIDITKGVQFCAGYLVPNPQSPEAHGLVLELNLFTHP